MAAAFLPALEPFLLHGLKMYIEQVLLPLKAVVRIYTNSSCLSKTVHTLPMSVKCSQCYLKHHQAKNVRPSLFVASIGTTTKRCQENKAQVPSFKEHVVKVQTCGDLYQQWGKTRTLYSKAPKGGITVDIKYIRTNEVEPSQDKKTLRPVVLLLHGSPGSYADYSLLASVLWQQGFNAVIPTWPDLTLSHKTDLFWHTAAEKAQLIKDFLKAIGITKVDALISHSSAQFPSLVLYKDKAVLGIKGLILLNAPGCYPCKSLQPFAIQRKLMTFYQNPQLRPFVRAFYRTLKAFGVGPLRLENLDHPLLSLITMLLGDFDEITENVKQLASDKMPTLLIYSGNDKLVEKSLAVDLYHRMGVQDNEVWWYDAQGQLMQKGLIPASLLLSTCTLTCFMASLTLAHLGLAQKNAHS